MGADARAAAETDDKKDKDDKFGEKNTTSRRGALPSAAAKIGDSAMPAAASASPGQFASNATPTGWWSISDRNPANSKMIRLGPRTASSINAFISAIWGHIEGWGIAGRGMYWRPVLQVRVAPGGEERFADLAALLDGSGLTVKRR